MTDDLTRGYEGQDDNVTESAEATTSETGTESSVAMVGQAGEAIVVSRPAPGQTVEIQAAAGQTYVLDFPPGEAQVQVQGDNFILAFDDDGDGTPDSQIVFNNLVNLVDAGEAPTFQVAGVNIDSSVLLNQALAFAGEQPDLIDVAAGPGAIGGGNSVYDDNLGDAIDLLVAQGVIPPVELQFGLIALEPDPILLEAEEEIPLLINEIGVRVAMEIPGLPGEPTDDEPLPSPQADSYEGYCEELPEYNFVELINTSGAGFDPSGLVLQILGEDLGVTAFTIPGGVPAIPAGGFIVFYQLADPQDDGTPGTEDIVWRVFNADGDVVSGGTIADAPFWDLGDDTTDPIGVNLLTDGESVDTFAANITDGQLAALTDPEFGGAPDGFGSPLLDLNFDTFNGQFTGNHHIFSRVDLDDTDSQSDWTTNNIPTDGALNTTGLPGGPFAYSIGYDSKLVAIDLSDGTVYEIGAVFDSDGNVYADFEGLTFGKGADAGFLFAIEDSNSTILKIDPSNGEVVETFELDSGPDLYEPGLTVAADGTFYAVGGDQGVYEVTFSGNDYNLTQVASDGDFGDFYPTGLVADPSNPDLLYAVGQDDGEIKLFTVVPSTGVVTQLPGVIGFSYSELGLSFDADGNLWIMSEELGIAQLDPTTGAYIPGSEISLPYEHTYSFESIAVLLEGVPNIADLNPWDPLNDDMNPGQNNPDPLAGQNFLQAEAGGDLVEGRGGPDFILGAGGNDSLYGGSEDLYLEQTEKVLNQAEQIFSNLFGGEGAEGGAAALSQQPYFSDHNDFLFGDAGDDEIYGGSGGDYMIGGQGNDSMDGGTGDDQIYGDGSDEEGGVGGLPDSDPNHAGHDAIAGDALNNVSFYGGEYGDVRAAADVPFYYGDVAGAVAIMGGNDTILAGNGDDKVGGDALAEGSEGAIAYSYADDSYERPADGLYREDAGFGNDTINGEEGNDSIGGDAAAVVDASEGYGYEFAAAEGFNIAAFGYESDAQVGSDSIEGGEGSDIIGGDAMAVVSGSEGYADAEAFSLNVAEENGYQAEGCEGYSSYPSAHAGNDSIVGDTIEDDGVFGEYGYQVGGNDTIGGDAAASADGYRGDAGAYSINDASTYNGMYGTYASTYAGNDTIVGDMDGGEGYGGQGYLDGGSDTIGGDAAAVADGYEGYAGAYGNNYAESGSYGNSYNSSYSSAGNDHIVGDSRVGGLEGGLSGGHDFIGGDAAAAANNSYGYAYGSSNNEAYAGNDYYGGSSTAVAGSDYIVGDNSFSGAEGSSYAGNDTIGGDAAASANGYNGDAYAVADNEAVADSYEGYTYAGAGNDTIHGDDVGYSYYGIYNGNDLIGGDAAASATGDYGYASANAYNSAEGNAAAGNDSIFADNGEGGEYGEAGNDSVGGDAAARGYDADAYTENEAWNGASAGVDNIYTYAGDDVIGGDSLSVKLGNDLLKGTATTYNTDYGNSRAGTDYIDAAQGNDLVGGDSTELAQNGYANAETYNTSYSYNEYGEAGDDTIYGRGGNDSIGGDSTAKGVYADAWTENEAHFGGSAGNDTIHAGTGDDTFAGGSLSIESGNQIIEIPDETTAVTWNTEYGEAGVAGSDLIYAGEGDDIGAGDSAEFATGAYGFANAETYNTSESDGGHAGDDVIYGGSSNNNPSGDDTVAGGSLAKGYDADAYTENSAWDYGSAGNDSIYLDSPGDYGEDVFSGDSLSIKTGESR